MMNKRNVSATVLLGVVAAAVQNHSAEAFASPPSSLCATKLLPTSRSVEASLFRRRKRNADDDRDDTPLQQDLEDDGEQNSRRLFLSATVAAASMLPARAQAASDKRLNLSNDDLRQIILADIVDKSFLVSADITRSVYDESATFTDEIDVYTMDKWIKGTQSLFIPSGSRVSLVGDVDVSPSEVSFRFDEDLMFNIPFKPVCSLTGRVVLTRDEKTGLITSYREYWDQSVNEVLKTAKFGKKA
jgi:hypothetical protein